MLATVDLGLRTELLLDFIAEEIPALEVTGAQFSFFIFLIAGAHAGNAAFYLGAVCKGGDQFGDRDGPIGNGVFRIRHREARVSQEPAECAQAFEYSAPKC
jgi:hypothetical protein